MTKKPLFVALAVALIFAIFAIYLQEREDYLSFKAELGRLTGIELGETRSEILYQFQQPDTVTEADSDSNEGHNHPIVVAEGIPEGMSLNDYPEWLWQNEQIAWSVTFDDYGRVASIWCSAYDTPIAHNCNTVENIGTHSAQALSQTVSSHESTMVDYLGRPDRVNYDSYNELNRKIAYYDDYGLQFIMVGGRIVGIVKTKDELTFLGWLKRGRPQVY